MNRVAADPLVIETPSGAVRGTVVHGVRTWRGIPYGAAPVGPLRFRSPQPVEPWDGVRAAQAFGPAAPQHEGKAMPLPDGIVQSEDCLTLNVFAADRESDADPDQAGSADAGGDDYEYEYEGDGDGATGPLRPVMVWIHGGAYVAGCSAPALYDPTHLIERGDIVFVSVNYRLGALGFLDFSSLATEEEPFDTNVGLRDILLALQWVKNGIAAFGGDPDNVTIFGESAGAGCVTTLLTSPAAEGLFHRAIAESSPATSVYDQTRAAAVSRRFLDLLGVAPEQAGELRRVSPERLSAATFELVAAVAADAPGSLAIAPVVDGDVVPVHPLDSYRAGTQLPVPLIIGTNHDEATLFRMMKSPLMPISGASVHTMFAELAAEHPDLAAAEARIESAYPEFPKRTTPAELSRDAGFRMPSIWLASAHSRRAPTWMYRFDHSTPMLKVLGLGATHGTEIAYVFGTLGVNKKDPSFDLGGLPEAERVSASMQAHWLAFAASGDPGSWAGYDEATRSTLVIGHDETVVDDPDSAVRLAWGDEVIGFI